MYTHIDDEELVLDVFPDANEEEIIDLLEALQSANMGCMTLREKLNTVWAHSNGSIAGALAYAWNEGTLD